MKSRILATLLVLCGLIGPEVCGAVCAMTASASPPVSIEVPAADDEHAAPCHGAADPMRAHESEPSDANHSGSDEMDCCDETVGIVNLAPSDELQARTQHHAAALLTAAIQTTTPRLAPLDTGPGTEPGSPYRSVNPPLLN